MKTYRLISISIVVTGMLIGASTSLASVGTATAVQANLQLGSGVMASSSTNMNATATSYNNSGTMYANTNASNGGNLNAAINIGSNDATLNADAQSIAQSDASVSAVSTSNNNVSISYNVPARLFGFIPVNMTETASVDTSAQGSTPKVSVHRSWWSFLASTNSNADTSTFSSNISSRIGASASSQATIMADIESAARASMSSSANVSGSASTGY
jgi:hypothetical protein